MPNSTKLGLPLLTASQSQKHVTHNEAINKLDILVQLNVLDRDLTAPPGSPVDGACYIVGSGATGAWATKDLNVAAYQSGAWKFFAPDEGWMAWVVDEDMAVIWTGAAWQTLSAAIGALDVLSLNNGTVTLLGINGATADTTNRLSMNALGALFNHAGAGFNMTLNKAATGDTLSQTWQTGFSTRAILGLIANNDFAIRTSANGSAFFNAVTFTAGSGRATFAESLLAGNGSAGTPAFTFTSDPNTGLYSAGADQLALATGGVQRGLLSTTGLQLDVLLTGTAVMQSDTDTTSGRLMKVGAGGWAKAQGAYPPEYDFDTWGVSPSGAYWFSNAADAGPEGLNYGVVLAMNYAAVRQMRLAMNAGASKAWIGYIDNAGVQSPWSMLYGQRSILGPVSQTGGVPDGALIERGSNANGGFTRWADGTQLCWRTMDALTGGAQTWTFPALFAAAPVLVGSAQSTVLSCFCLDVAPTTTTTTFSARDKTDARRADTCHLTAIGRWF